MMMIRARITFCGYHALDRHHHHWNGDDDAGCELMMIVTMSIIAVKHRMVL